MKPIKFRLQNWITCVALILAINTFYGQVVVDNPIIETYNTPGSFMWTCPANVSQIKVQCWGGGQGGWGRTGGTGGAYSTSLVYVIPGNVYYLNCGNGGGGDSWFNSVNSPPTSQIQGVLAKGGASVNNLNLCFGDTIYLGGISGNINGTCGGGGGSAAGPLGPGIDGGGWVGGIANNGGGGNGGNATCETYISANSGSFPGGGGGGGSATMYGQYFGPPGIGAKGMVVLKYYFNCSGFPNPGQITSNAAGGCGFASFNATYLSNSTGVLYQWQISNDNNSWVDINGETSTSYSTQLISSSYIRIKSYCQFSGLSSFSPSVFYQVFPTPSNPEIENVGSSNICQNDSTLLISNINSGMTFNWLKNNIIINGETNNSIYVKESGNYQLTIYNEFGCSSSSNIVNVNVNPRPIITSETSKTICSGQTVNLGLTSDLSSLYTWVATNNSNVNGESTTIQSSSTINEILTNNSSTNQTVTYTATPNSTSGNCLGTPQPITITVVPPVVLTNVTSKTICLGSAVGITLASNVPASYSWTVVDNPNVTGESTATQTTSSINNTLSTSSSTIQNVTYTVTPTSTTASCAGNPQSIVVSVVPTIVMTNSNTVSICSGTAVNLSLTSSIPGTYSIIATNNTNTNGENTTVQTGTNIIDLINNNTSTNQNVTYTVTPTTINGSCVGTNQTITITVFPAVTMTNAASKTICSGNSVNLPLTSNVTSSYSWSANTDNTNISGESLTAQTGTTINNTLTNNSTVTQQVIYTVTPSSSLGSCVGTPQTVTITVVPTVTMTNNNSKTICSGSAVGITLSSIVPSNYSWVATSNTSITGESTANQTTSIINNTLSTSSNIVQNVTYTVTPTSIIGNCVGSPQTIIVSVVPNIVMNNPNTTTICNGSAINLNLTSNITGTYSWSAIDNLSTTGESTTIQTGTSITDLITNNVSSIQTVTYSVTPTTSIGSCIGTNQTINVTIIPSVVLTNSTSKTICSGNSVNLALSSNVSSSYIWVATSNSSITGESTTNQTTGTINNILTNTISVPEVVTYTVIPTSTTSSCAGSPQTVLVTVNPLPVVTNSNTLTICSGSNINFTLTSNIPSTFTWVANSNTNVSGESLTNQSGSTINNTLINNSTTNQNVTYTITPTSITDLCVGTPQITTITVIPTVTMTSASSKTICSGNAVNLGLTSSVSSTYSWSAIDNLSTTGESTTIQTGTSITDLITNNVSSIQTVTYSVTPTTSIGGCPGVTQNVVVTIVPIVSLTNNLTKTICSGGNVNISLDSNVPSSYSWSATNNLSTSGESTSTQSSSTITNLITNNSTGSQVVNYTITPISTSGNCQGIPAVIAVTILPVVTMSSSNTATICSGSAVNLSFTSNLPSTYSWVATNNTSITGESTTPQIDSILTNTLNSSATTNQSVIYTVTPTSINGLCVGTSQNINITVNPLPNSTFNTSGPTTFCQGGTLDLNVNPSNGQSYQWFNNGTVISGANSNNYTITSSGLYSITINNNYGCASLSDTINVIVNANPVSTIDNQGISLICQGGTVLLTANTGTGLTYQWANNGTNISGATSSSYSANAAGSYTVIVTNSSGCSTTSNATVLTMNQLTSTLYPTNSTMNTGYVTSGGTKTSGNMLVSTSTTYGRGWAKFPLTSIPTGSVITAVTIKFYTYGGTASATSNTIRGFNGDPVTMTGSTLYSTIGSGTSYNTSTWSIGSTTTPSLNTKNLSTAGVTFVQNQLSIGYVNFGFIGGSTSLQSIYGYSNSTYRVRLEITYNPPATSASISSTGNTIFCQGNSVSLNANSGSGLTYQWKNNGSNISGTSSSYTATSSGNYTVQVTNSSGCSTISNPTTVSVNPLPMATLSNTGTLTFCQGGSVSLNANIGSGLTYQWKKNGVIINGVNTSSYSVTTSGSYTVVITNTNGCSATSNTLNVVVNALPNPIISGITSICQGDTSILSINSTTGITYQWRNNGININDATNYFYAAASPGSYSVFVVNANGCSATSPSVSFTINQLPTSSISASNATTFCQGGSTNLTADNNVGLSYQWYKNGLPMNGNNSLSYSATTSGNYNVYFTNSNGCSNYSSNSITVTVLSLPNLSISGDSNICQGETTNLTASSNGTISWNGNLNQNSIQVSPNVSTSYSVSSVGSNGCTIQDQVLVIVNYPSDTTIYTSSYGPFELNGQIYQASGIYTQNLQTIKGCDSTVTIHLNYITNSNEELSDVGINIYPNPSNDGIFYLKNENSMIQNNLGIYNSIGQFLLEQIDSNIIDLSSLSDGAYWIRFIVNEQLFFVRVIKG